MSLYVLFVYAHIVTAVVLAGYALFWVVMSAAARREPISDAERARLIDMARNARWPLSGGKLSLKAVGWLLLIAVVVTGALSFPARFSLERLLAGGTAGNAMLAKIVLVAVFVACLPKLGTTRVPPAVIALAAVLASVVASVLVVR
jgi:hypothetical protein